MPLVETLFLTLGPTIGKHILKHWLKSDLSQDLSQDMLYLFSEKTNDFLAQRQGKRQFEEIGEKVAEDLLPVFVHEGRSLDEGRRTAVALAVNNTLKQSSADLLVEKDLSSIELVAHWRQSDIEELNLFSELETRLYNRLLDELAIYIVDIASQLPHFSERTFAKLLKDNRQLLDKADQVLEQIHRIRQAVGDTEQAAQFEADYRLAVIRQLDELELFGVKLSDARRRHRLRVGYVTLQTELRAADGGHKPVTIPFDQALASTHRLLVRGWPGSGKTTLLKWVALQTAAQRLDSPLADWNQLLPFFIRLRQVQNQLPRPEEFPNLVAPEIAESMPPQWVHNLLKAGYAVVLIDGLDEVPQAQRKSLEQWLKELVETFPKTHFIVTSRYYVEVGWLTGLGFSTAELQAMNLANIDLFIDRWHEAVAVSLQEKGRVDNSLRKLAAHLKSDIRYRRTLRNLAVNPLLCAMLCAINRKYRGQLPTMRLELYEECVHMLLERGDMEQRVDLLDYPNLSYADKEALLGDLAYWMLRNGWSEVPLEKVEQHLAHTMRFMPHLPSDATASQVRRLFTERSRLLRQTGEAVNGQLYFIHRTFQEYLAAQEAINRDDLGVLIGHAHREQWQEVIIVAIGAARRQQAAELLTKLIERGDQERNNRHYLYLLAMASLETVRKLEPAIISKIEERVGRIVPPKNKQESTALAKTRELAVPYLGYRPEYSPQIAVLCVQTLSQIGGEAALEVLKSYVGDARKEVESALLNAWDSFDRQGFAEHIFKPLVGERTKLLSCAHFSSLEGFEQVPHLEHVKLGTTLAPSTASNLMPIKNLSKLRHLTLSNFTKLSDLTPLRELSALTSLNLRFCQQVSDLSPLQDLTALTCLDLTFCQQVSDLTSLSNLSALTFLNLSGCRNIRSLSPLKGLTKLKTVHLEGVPTRIIDEFKEQFRE